MALRGRAPREGQQKGRRGKKSLASIESIIAAVEACTGVSHEELACPGVAGEVLLARRYLFYAFRWYGGITNKRICEMYGVWPNTVCMDQRHIRLATYRTGRRSFRLEVKETLDNIRFSCRAMARMERE